MEVIFDARLVPSANRALLGEQGQNKGSSSTRLRWEPKNRGWKRQEALKVQRRDPHPGNRRFLLGCS